jgi:hypothetical protein
MTYHFPNIALPIVGVSQKKNKITLTKSNRKENPREIKSLAI